MERNSVKICLYCARYNFEPLEIMPLGSAYLAAYLIQQKIVNEDEIRIVDNLDEAIAFEPDILGVSAVSQVIRDARDFVKKFKEQFSCFAVLGGYHVSCIPEKLPEEFDIGVLGEGEKTFAETVRLFKEKDLSPETLKKVKGICYYKNGEIVINEPRELIEDIDSLPLPYRHREYSKEVPIFTSRGCPYKCIFCASQKFWGNRFRLRNANSVVSEIDYLVNEYHPEEIAIMDDLWMSDKKRFREIVDNLIKLKIPEKVSFRGFCRSNIVGEEEIILLKQMNFSHIRFGAETGSEALLKRLKRDSISIADHQRVIDLCQKHKIPCMASFMFGIPGETKDDLQATLDFLEKNKEKIKGVIGGFYLFNPIPGTEIWYWMKDKKMISDDFLFECLQIDFMKKNFSWDNIMYFNQDCVPLEDFRKYIENIRVKFASRKHSKKYLLYSLLKKCLGEKITKYTKKILLNFRDKFKTKAIDQILVEVGSGNNPKPGYIHCDIRPTKHVEYVCNAWAIPLEHESVDEIYARHVLEHLTYKQAKRTLKHWLCILKVGGRLDINVPDLEKHIEQLSKEGYSPYLDFNLSNREHAMASIYGWQSTDCDIHKWGYTFETLSKLLIGIGYSNIKRIDDTSISGPLNLRIIAEKDRSLPKLKLDPESLKPKWRYYNLEAIIKNCVYKFKKLIKKSLTRYTCYGKRPE